MLRVLHLREREPAGAAEKGGAENQREVVCAGEDGAEKRKRGLKCF
jgi:hypothetical protein